MFKGTKNKAIQFLLVSKITQESLVPTGRYLRRDIWLKFLVRFLNVFNALVIYKTVNKLLKVYLDKVNFFSTA